VKPCIHLSRNFGERAQSVQDAYKNKIDSKDGDYSKHTEDN